MHIIWESSDPTHLPQLCTNHFPLHHSAPHAQMFFPPLPVSCGIIAVSSAISSLFSIPAPCWIASQQSPSWIILPNLMLFSVQLPSEGVRNCISSNIMTMGMNSWIQQAIYKLRIHPEFTLSNKYKVLGRPIICWNKCSQSLPAAVWLLATLHDLTKGHTFHEIFPWILSSVVK